jgi:NAD(P)H-dependent FMN reductase
MQIMKYCILSSSGREGSQSHRIALIVQQLLAQLQSCEADVVDLANVTPASWDPWDPASQTEALQRVSAACDAADALVFVVPEWGGMAPPVLKYVLQHLTDGQISHKPGMLIGISSGASGTYPIAELRAFGFKNSHLVLVPHHVIMRNINETQDSARGTEQMTRLSIALRELTIYADALAPVRQTLNDLRDRHLFGM